MVIGEHNRETDINVNPTKEKKLTNVRASGKDENVDFSPHPADDPGTGDQFYSG
jgi:GTP-binding protein